MQAACQDCRFPETSFCQDRVDAVIPGPIGGVPQLNVTASLSQYKSLKAHLSVRHPLVALKFMTAMKVCVVDHSILYFETKSAYIAGHLHPKQPVSVPGPADFDVSQTTDHCM
jgi:hypothetical protein